jgi:hypothetical protein
MVWIAGRRLLRPYLNDPRAKRPAPAKVGVADIERFER